MLKRIFLLCLVMSLSAPLYGPIREARRYYFCDKVVFELVNKYSKDSGVPLSLALAVISVESRFDTQARGKHGEAGLFQLMRIHGSERETLEGNIRIGAAYLAKHVKELGARDGLRRYNGGRRWADKSATETYARKVLRAERRMKTELEFYRRSLSLESAIKEHEDEY